MPQSSLSAASQHSIVEHFSIDGLFGYRSISLSSKFAATVLIARNGSGKTTLLAALDAFLRGQFTRFAGMQLDKVTCKLRNYGELVLTGDDIQQLTDLSTNDEISVRAKSWEIEPLTLLELISGDIEDKSYTELIENPTFYSIYSKQGYNFFATKQLCDRLAATLKGKNPHVDKIRNTLRSALRDIEIVYLPTYRRIELSLPTQELRPGERRKNVLSKLGVAKNGLYTADIQFGLGDISDRLRTLYSEMLSLSNQGYGKVSANIINALISGDYKKDDGGANDLPTKESLEIFFARIKEAEKEYARTRYGKFFATPDLNRVYSGDIPEDARPFLGYFLNQLNSVIKETRGTEELVEAFIRNCNRYLSGEDKSTDQYSESNSSISDQKQLTFNRRNLEVKVTSSTTKKEIPLEALSSGEKQMISLFARLYLYQDKKIILIDEPELSLSLDWQRQILPDVLNAPTCKQVIAITHSPFIFDNELEPFAGSLHLRIDPLKENPPNVSYKKPKN